MSEQVVVSSCLRVIMPHSTVELFLLAKKKTLRVTSGEQNTNSLHEELGENDKVSVLPRPLIESTLSAESNNRELISTAAWWLASINAGTDIHRSEDR